MGRVVMGAAPGAVSAPHLVIISPERLRGTILALAGERQVIGRGADCDLCIGDPRVSHVHAAVCRSDGRTTVEDLGSTNGTEVNGSAVGPPRRLRHGDVISFGPVRARYEEAGAAGQTMLAGTVTTGSVAGSGVVAGPPARGGVTFNVDRQHADRLSNVAGDQYNEQYFQYVRQEHESFLRQIAATRTRARRLIAVSFATLVLGLGTYLWALLQYASQLEHSVAGFGRNPDAPFNMPRLFGPDIGGVPVGLIGFAVAFIGSIGMIVGIVLHIVATSRRRRAEAEMRQPWPPMPHTIP